MTTQEIISAIGLIGLGGLLKGLLDFIFAGRKRISEKKQDFKETRYKSIILLCYAYINFEREKATWIIHRPDINSKEHLFNELNTEWMNMMLFASDSVLMAMKGFLETSNHAAFHELALTMRQDLYGIKTRINIKDLSLNQTTDFLNSAIDKV